MNRRENVAAQACGLAGDVVRTFGEVRLRVFGTSMVPSMHPGDLISVQRAGVSEISSGEIVLYSREGRMFVHRVVDRGVVPCTGSPEQPFAVQGEPLLITRGDRLCHNDPPVSSSELLGRVTSIRRNGIERGDLQVESLAQPSESNRLLLRLLQTSDYATYLYLRLAVLWGRFAGRTFSPRRRKGSSGNEVGPGGRHFSPEASGAKESVRQPGAVPCSARLQASMCLNLQCSPEGRRYKSLSLALNAEAKAPTHKPDESLGAGLRTEDTEGVVECQA